jgi:hypothetical protein
MHAQPGTQPGTQPARPAHPSSKNLVSYGSGWPSSILIFPHVVVAPPYRYSIRSAMSCGVSGPTALVVNTGSIPRASHSLIISNGPHPEMIVPTPPAACICGKSACKVDYVQYYTAATDCAERAERTPLAAERGPAPPTQSVAQHRELYNWTVGASGSASACRGKDAEGGMQRDAAYRTGPRVCHATASRSSRSRRRTSLPGE